jgi:hypothetical protein
MGCSYSCVYMAASVYGERCWFGCVDLESLCALRRLELAQGALRKWDVHGPSVELVSQGLATCLGHMCGFDRYSLNLPPPPTPPLCVVCVCFRTRRWCGDL